MSRIFVGAAVAVLGLVAGAAWFSPPALWSLLVIISLSGPWYVMKRVGPGEVLSYHEMYPVTEPGSLLASQVAGPLGEA